MKYPTYPTNIAKQETQIYDINSCALYNSRCYVRARVRNNSKTSPTSQDTRQAQDHYRISNLIFVNLMIDISHSTDRSPAQVTQDNVA